MADGDYRYSDEAREHDLMIVWKCNSCGRKREDYPGINEGGRCDHCPSGEYVDDGESYTAASSRY